MSIKTNYCNDGISISGKMVLNKCHGGFSISARAVKRLAELKNQPCYFFKDDFNKRKSHLTPTTLEEIEASNCHFYRVLDIEDPNKLSCSELLKHEHSSSNLDRTDPMLIQVIEELGKKANGQCAELKIVEFNHVIEINDYDGYESIAYED